METARERAEHGRTTQGFQFPSNGKARGNPACRRMTQKPRMKCFNSLQTGRHVETGLMQDTKNLQHLPFQFPSNGKARGNNAGQLESLLAGPTRFQFPSNGKARGNPTVRCVAISRADRFQFPSNGKARGNP